MVATSTKTRKAKGRKFQLEIAEMISKILDISVEKDGDLDVRPMGMSGVDIILRGKALELFPMDIECKAIEQLSLYSWIEQAIKNNKKGRDWLLFHKKSNRKPIVIMNAERFFELYKKVLREKSNEAK